MSDIDSSGYFTEHFDSGQHWLATHLKFNTPPQPFYRVYTGGEHRRFMLASPKLKCHWGQFLRGLEGILLLRNPTEIDPNDMPIPSISSADIERFKQQNPDTPLQYWANFFAEKLLLSSTHFLYAADWKIYPMKYQSAYSWTHFESDILKLDMNGLEYHFDWQGFPEDSIIPLKSLPDEHAGRVKWWRKKIREHTCPPLLLWWHNHMQAFVMVDGHARLKAYQLEQVKPSCLVIHSFEHVDMGYDIHHPKRIEQRLKTLGAIKSSLDKGGSKLSMETLNHILIQIYQKYETNIAILTPKVIANLDEVFEQDLLTFVDDKRVDQDFLQSLLA